MLRMSTMFSLSECQLMPPVELIRILLLQQSCPYSISKQTPAEVCDDGEHSLGNPQLAKWPRTRRCAIEINLHTN